MIQVFKGRASLKSEMELRPRISNPLPHVPGLEPLKLF